MDDFLQDYDSMSRSFYIENYTLKKEHRLIFLESPPILDRYPNENRVIKCRQTVEKLKSMNSKDSKERKFSFSLDEPTLENPEYVVYGYNNIIFQKYKSDVTVKGKAKEEIEWLPFEKIEEETLSTNGSNKIDQEKKKEKELAEIKKAYQNEEEVERCSQIVQKYVLRWKAGRIMDKLKRRKKNREHGVREIWKTEDDYVKDLKVLKEVYVEPLSKLSQQKNKPIITPKDHKMIFQGLETITLFNTGLEKSLKKSIFSQNGEYNHYNLLSREIHAISPFLKMYNEYCARYDKTMAHFKELKKNNKRFAQQLEKMDKDPRTNKLGLTNYLIKPIQRVPRYTILIKAVIKNTEPEHPDYEGLKKAMVSIEQTAGVLNKRIHEIDNSERVMEIQQEFIPTKRLQIFQPFRRFVKEGTIYRGKVPFYVHLFNDVIVFSNQRKKLGGKQYQYELETFHHLSELVIMHTKNLLYRRHINMNGVVYNFKTKEERNEWMIALSESKRECIKKGKAAVSSRGGMGGSTMVHVSTIKEDILVTVQEDFDLSDEECIMETKNFQKPTVMLKYVKTKKIFGGSSHYRKFLLSGDEKRIYWGSPKKSLAWIDIADIKEVSIGQNTLTFRRNPKPSAVGLSFSLCYGKGDYEINDDDSDTSSWTGKTLDLVCLNKRDYEIWVRALKFVVQDKGESAFKRKCKWEKTLDLGKILKLGKAEKFSLDQRDNMGDLYTFGGGRSYGLGHGVLKDLKKPKIVRRTLLVDVEKVSCGKNAAISILSNGQVLSWGQNEGGRLAQGNMKNFTQPGSVKSLQEYSIVEGCIGDDFSLFLDVNGTILGCGSNQSGVLTASIEKNRIAEPEIIATSGTRDPYVHISCSPNTASAITRSGKVYLWGNGSFGQMGHGDKKNYNEMKAVEALKREVVVQVAFGNWHTLFLTKRGEVWCSGDGSFGQMGMIPRKKSEKIESCVPVKIPKLKGIVFIASGQFHCGAIDKEGRAFFWGAGGYGQIGNDKTDKINYVPVEIKNVLLGGNQLVPARNFIFKEISCGDNHNIAIIERKNKIELNTVPNTSGGNGGSSSEETPNNEGSPEGNPNPSSNSSEKRYVLTWGFGMHGRLGLDREDEKSVSIPTCVTFFDKKNELRSVCAGGQMSTVTIAHQWIPDDEVQECMECGAEFKFTRRRHHCRWCLGVFCGKCTKKKTTIMSMGFQKPQRVCDNCFNMLQKITE